MLHDGSTNEEANEMVIEFKPRTRTEIYRQLMSEPRAEASGRTECLYCFDNVWVMPGDTRMHLSCESAIRSQFLKEQSL